MENIDISLILSIIALIGSIFTYFIHDRKIKAQEKLINDYQISKIEEEKMANKIAILRGTLLNKSSSERTIRIYNKGKNAAKNIRLEIDNKDNYHFFGPELPFPLLHEQEKIDITIFLTTETPENISFTILWDDEQAIDNEHNQIIQLF